MAIPRPWSPELTSPHDSVASGLKAAWMVVLPLCLAVALPLFLVSDVPNAHRSSAWMVTLAIMAWSGLRLSALCVSGQPRLFDFFFWLYCYIFIGLGATVQLRSNGIAETTPGMDPTFDLPVALLVALGLAMYETGRLLGSWRSGGSPATTDRSDIVAQPFDVNEPRTVALTVLSLLVTAYFLSRVGLSSLTSDRETMNATQAALWPDPAVRAIFSALATFPLLVGVGALAQLRAGGITKGMRDFARIGLMSGAVLLLLVENPIVSARYTFGTVAFALAVYFGAATSFSRVRLTMVSTLFGFLFVFPIADAFRYSSGVRDSRSGFFAEYVGNGDYDSFWQIVNAYTYWQQGLVEPLRQLLGSMLFWVPRSIWADKPSDTGILLANYRGYSFDNLSAPLWAEALVNGGVIALVLVFLLVGYVLARMDHRLILSMAEGGIWGIVGAVFPVYLTILLRGSLLQATGTLAITTACVFAVRRSAATGQAR